MKADVNDTRDTDYKGSAQAAMRSADDVLAGWLPGGKRQGPEYVVGNPTRSDDRPGSFSINLTSGVWKDFSTGDGGADFVSLVADIEGVRNGEAAKEFADFLGVNGRHYGPKTKRAARKALLPVPDEAPPPPAEHPKLGTPSATCTYRDADGRTLCHVLRFEDAPGKQFRPLTYCESAGKRAWRWQGPPEPRPLYGLDGHAANPEAPVIVTEGEKAADAAAQLLPAYVAVSPMNGAQSPSKADWTPLAGREVIVWPDHDEARRKFATKLQQLTGASVADPPELATESGWDAADALEMDVDRLRAWLAGAKQPPRRTPEVAGFRLTEHGVLEVREDSDGDRSEIPVTFQPVTVEALARDGVGEDWGRLVVWCDHDGREHRLALPAGSFHSRGNELAQALANGGLPMAHGRERLLLEYLTALRPDARLLAATSTGWHEGAFVLPFETINEPARERIVYQPSGLSSISKARRRQGSLDEWRAVIGDLPPIGKFMVCASLAVPFRFHAGIESGGFHLHIRTSTGKTTKLQAAASVWGDGCDPLLASGRDAMIKRWNATSNALEGLAEAYNDLPLCVDEIGEGDGKDCGSTIYRIFSGTGQGRSRRDCSLSDSRSWRTSVLSAGELPVSEYLTEGGARVRGGRYHFTPGAFRKACNGTPVEATRKAIKARGWPHTKTSQEG